MRPVKNPLTTHVQIGKKYKHRGSSVHFTVKSFEPCEFKVCPVSVRPTCSGHYFLDHHNYRWHDIKGDFVEIP